jgi:DNA-binding CsgD family transcriptional regulator
MNSLALTEKQQEAVWLRYGRRASIKQIAMWLRISRRAVLARLRNARRRTGDSGVALPIDSVVAPGRLKSRMYSASQIRRKSGRPGLSLDHL